MRDIQENIEAAVANAAAKVAEADTIEEAQQWQSVISNLTSSLHQIAGPEPVAAPEPAIAASPSPTTIFEDLGDNGTDEINVDEDEEVDN